MAKKKVKKEDNFEQIKGTLTRGEQFIEKNQKYITWGLIGVLAAAALILGYQRYILQPKEEAAVEEAFMAQQYFEKDSFELAINGDGEFPGFLAISDDYSSTAIGNTANYYLGVSYYKLGEYDKAIDYMKKFKTDDKMLNPISKGVIGDAYTEKGDATQAAEFYKKAVNVGDNDLTGPVYLMKLGRAHETNGNWNDALSAYETIKTKYSDSPEGRSIEKYITRAKLNLN